MVRMMIESYMQCITMPTILQWFLHRPMRLLALKTYDDLALQALKPLRKVPYQRFLRHYICIYM
jgi:hypothetical protein